MLAEPLKGNHVVVNIKQLIIQSTKYNHWYNKNVGLN